MAEPLLMLKDLTDLQLRALQACLACSRFELAEHLRGELVDNPHLAAAHEAVLAEIRNRATDSESEFYRERASWEGYASSPLHRATLRSIVERLCAYPDWATIPRTEKIQRLRSVARPLQVSDELAADLIPE